MKIEELDMNVETPIDARQMASALIDLENTSRGLRVKAADHQREAILILREAEGVESATEILRKKLSMALHGS